MCAAATRSADWRRYGMLLGVGGLASFPPLTRVRIEQLACCEPIGLGLRLTHWTTRSLADVATATGIAPHIAHSTVSLILRQATLQPHRFRYWQTPRLDAEFVLRASRVLWCYEQVERLWQRDEIVLCWDEKPNLQALERHRQPMRPRQVERQEFDYLRHGTVNFAVALVVHGGIMRGWCLERNNSEQLCPILQELFSQFKGARKLHLIWDGGSSHTSDFTHRFLQSYRGWVRVVPTPPHASWLNQAELLLHAFSRRYLYRGSWSSRTELMEHLRSSVLEYNEIFAHPFNWSWTRHDMRDWVNKESKRLH